MRLVLSLAVFSLLCTDIYSQQNPIDDINKRIADKKTELQNMIAPGTEYDNNKKSLEDLMDKDTAFKKELDTKIARDGYRPTEEDEKKKIGSLFGLSDCCHKQKQYPDETTIEYCCYIEKYAKEREKVNKVRGELKRALSEKVWFYNQGCFAAEQKKETADNCKAKAKTLLDIVEMHVLLDILPLEAQPKPGTFPGSDQPFFDAQITYKAACNSPFNVKDSEHYCADWGKDFKGTESKIYSRKPKLLLLKGALEAFTLSCERGNKESCAAKPALSNEISNYIDY